MMIQNIILQGSKAIFILFFIFPISLSSQPLNSLLQQAVKTNTGLQALHIRYESALKKAPQVGQLPQPKIGMGVPILGTQTRLGGQVLTIGASQVFPWFGTLDAKKDIAITMAKVQYEKIMSAKLELFYQVKTAYYQLYLLEKTQEIISNQKDIYQSLEEIALGKVENGKGTAVNVLSTQLKQQNLHRRWAQIDAKKILFYAKINAIIKKDFDIDNQSFIQIDTSFLKRKPNLPKDFLRKAKEKIKANHPLVNQLNLNIVASEQIQKLNDLQNKPSLSFGLDYTMITPRSDAEPLHNGRDVLIPKIGITIPLYKDKYRAKAQEEALIQSAITLEKENLTNQIMGRLQGYYSSYQEALIIIDWTQKQIKTLHAMYNVLLSEYSSNGNRFDELLLLQNQLLENKEILLKATIKIFIAQAEIDRLTDF